MRIKSLLLAALLSLAAIPAGAVTNILFQGTEDVDFTIPVSCGNSCLTSTDTSTFRTTWGRSSLKMGFVPAGGDPPLGSYNTPNFTPTQTIWLHAQYCEGGIGGACGAVNNSVNGGQMVLFVDDAGTAVLIVRGTGNNNEVKVSRRTAGGAFTDLVTCPGAFGATLTQIDVKVTLAVSGEATIYTNSVQVCQFLGDTTNGDGSTHFQSVKLSSAFPSSTQQGNGFWSEVIVADGDTRSMNLFTMYPISAGASSAWNGLNACTSIVNNNPFNDLSYISTGTNNLIEECTPYKTLPAGTYNVLDVGLSMRGAVGGTGPQNFNFVTRVSGTDFFNADTPLLNTMSNVSNYLQPTNPSTSLPWTTSDISAAGFQYGLRSRP